MALGQDPPSPVANCRYIFGIRPSRPTDRQVPLACRAAGAKGRVSARGDQPGWQNRGRRFIPRTAGEALLGPRRQAAQMSPDQAARRSTELEIEPQAELSALALGPDNSLATAGNTAGGVAIRIWDLDSPSSQTSLNPPAQSYTRMMRFSPQGNLLAIMGSGPIELWDPVALNLVAGPGECLTRPPTWHSPRWARPWRPSAGRERRCSGRSTIRRRGPNSAVSTTRRRRWHSATKVCWPGSAQRRNLVLAQLAAVPEIGPPSPGSPASIFAQAVRRIEPKRSERLGAAGPADRDARRRARTAAGVQSVALCRHWHSTRPAEMVLHDMQGLRVYPGGLDPLESPPATRIASAADARIRAGPDDRHGQNTRRANDGSGPHSGDLSLARRSPRRARSRELPAQLAA